MAKRSRTPQRKSLPPVIATVVKAAAERLTRIETLLMELDFALAKHAKRVSALRVQQDAIAADARATRALLERTGRRPGPGAR